MAVVLRLGWDPVDDIWVANAVLFEVVVDVLAKRTSLFLGMDEPTLVFTWAATAVLLPDSTVDSLILIRVKNADAFLSFDILALVDLLIAVLRVICGT